MDMESPFRPGSDAVPVVWAGRELELADASRLVRRRLQGIYERGRLVTGDVGLGKSVLVNRVASDLRAAGHLVARTVRLPVKRDPVPLFAAAVADLVADSLGAGLRAAAERIKTITLPLVGGGIALAEPVAATPEALLLEVRSLLRQVGLQARRDGRVVVLRIDELQNAPIDGLSSILTLVGDALDETMDERDPAGGTRTIHLPIVVYLSGLPAVRDAATAAGTTFSRRFAITELEVLDEAALRSALAMFRDGTELLGPDGPTMVRMTEECIDTIVDRCLGDPFLFQLAGDAAWLAAPGPVIDGDAARRGWQIASREARSYVEGRYRHLAEQQMHYLRTAATLAPQQRTSAAVATAFGRTTRQLGSTLDALISTHGLLVRTDDRLAFRSAVVEANLRGEWP